MSVPASVMNEVKTWLNSQHVKVPLDWVQACVEFLLEEYQVQYESGSLQKLKNCVYGQWLAADLQEIGVQCLPPDLPVSQKLTLQGYYALQVNGVRDVGRSAYSQLKELDGVANENAEVSATPKPFVPEWEAKPTRMLVMNLTDGVTCVQGMEYKPISFLSADLPVGVKVLIQGPVDCRFGVILLTAEKIRVLGGEVEALKERYSKQEVLREALQLRNGNEDVENGHSENQHSARPGSESSAMQNMRSSPVQHRVHQQTSDSISSHLSVVPGCPANQQSHPQDSSERTDQSFEGFSDAENLDFDNFEDDDAFIKSIDYNVLEQIEKESTPSVLHENDDFEMSEDEEVYREVMALQENAEIDIERHVRTPPGQPKCSLSATSKMTSSTKTVSSALAKLPKSSTPVFSPSDQKASPKPSTSLSVDRQILSTSSVKPSVSSTSTTSSPVNQQISPQGRHTSDKPYSCLSSVLPNLNSSSEFTVMIKACVSAALSKLECSTTMGWQLTAKLNDGTGTIEATIHDKVLEEFIGIPAKEMVVLQKRAQSNVDIRNNVMEAISKCKKKLQCLNCLMEVKFSPNLSKPCVIKCFS